MNAFIIAVVAFIVVAQATDFHNVKFPMGHGRIVGGEEVVPHAYPYQAALAMKNAQDETFFCGGSLISKNMILTAAHCVDGFVSIEVTLGAHNIRNPEEPTQVKSTSKIFVIHEDWKPFLLKNDIALVQLHNEIELNENVGLVSMPSRADVDKTFTDELCTVTGWGRASDSSNGLSPVLRHVELPIITNLQCSISYPFMIHDTHICINGAGGKSSCNGDSGGPLVHKDKTGQIKQIGIVSFGKVSGCEKGYPGVFTRVTEYLDWIEKNAGIKIE
ncbi:Jonah 65Aiv [Carabus blaptoides fortunei]